MNEPHLIASRFSRDPAAMMSVMRDAHAVLAGSAALYFFLSTATGLQNFNIFTPFRTAALVVGHLQRNEGYHIVNSFSPYGAATDSMDVCIDNPSHYLSGVREVACLMRDGISIDVIASGIGSDSDSATVPLGCQWTTLLMGYVGSDGLCIPYPVQTLAAEGAYHVPRICHPSLGVGTNPAPLNKYLERGFQMFTHGCPDDHEHAQAPCHRWICPKAERSFGDGGCLLVLYPGTHQLAGLGTRWQFGGVPSRMGREVVYSRSAVHAPTCPCTF
ncbi:hypothetical protein LXA43DRAFT_898942 [Ganoderma leucocontextum]|nr:hypothetical protein LXA43DRAFT_898942 [Ganoderma leucocontextum]